MEEIKVNVLTFILLIILGIILNFIIRKYVKVSMVIITTLLIGLIIVVDVCIYALIFSSKLHIELPLMVKLFLIVISILPFVCIKGFISHTIRILDYCINKNKLCEMGYVEKGTIKEIRTYGFGKHGKDGYYLIVDCNGEKVKSIPFRYQQGGTMIKTTYKKVYNNGNSIKEKTEEILGEMPRLYNIGDTIDVIIYNNKKYVKLKEYELNGLL